MKRPYWRNENFRRAAKLAGVLIALALITRGIFGSDGFLTYLQKRREYHALHQKNLEIQQENQGLQKEIQGLKSDPVTIERYAREELNMARKHEKIYMLPQQEHSSADASVTQRQKDSSAPNP